MYDTDMDEMYDKDMEEQVVDSAGDDGDGMIEEDIDAIIESILADEADEIQCW
jgi:hypothetical protein